jgi:glutaredoxin-related protein
MLPKDKVSPAALEKMQSFHKDVIDEVKRALKDHRVVVIGMAWNSHVGKVRRALREAGIEHHYMEFGNYVSGWRKRLAIKLWSGWPTFPQVFVDGVLIGGEDLTKAAIASGEIQGAREKKSAKKAAAALS